MLRLASRTNPSPCVDPFPLWAAEDLCDLLDGSPFAADNAVEVFDAALEDGGEVRLTGSTLPVGLVFSACDGEGLGCLAGSGIMLDLSDPFCCCFLSFA